MLPQPPPNVPAPPPSPEALRSRRKWWALRSLGFIPVVAVIVMMGNAIRVHRNKAAITEARNDLRSMSCFLLEFDSAYGKFPDASTINLVREQSGSSVQLGTETSNDYFRQLIAAQMIHSETPFYARIPETHRPDNVFDPAHALEKGEVGYSYIVGLSSKSNPARPLVVTPLIPGTDRFDPKPFNGYAIVLTVGGGRTVLVLPINKNGEVIDSSGKHILDPANPIWGGEKPVIAWPDL